MSEKFIAMLALETHATLLSSQIVDQLKTMYPQFSDRLAAVDTGIPKTVPGESTVFHFFDVPMTVMFMDAPLPDGTLDQAIATNRIWPSAEEDLARHRAHVIIAPLSEAKGFHRARPRAALTTLTAAAIAQLTDCIGVYWAAGDTVSEKRSFVDAAELLAQNNDQYPILEWMQLTWLDGPPTESGQRTLAVVTTGLLPFIGRELEFQPAALPADVIGQRVIGTIAYLLINGPVLKDGDTIGVSDDESITVHYRYSGQRPDIPVFSMSWEKMDFSMEPKAVGVERQ